MPARVVLAMSGGVDSSVAAYQLKRQGYAVVGLFMRTGTHAPEGESPTPKKGCCSALDAGDARRVADRLDIPLYALDFEQEFGRVIDYFADEYLAGRTPNPCVVCNNWLKFGKLWDYGKELDADYIATGHYAQIVHRDKRPQLHRAVDAGKDQSYVLSGLRRDLLPSLLFPIGGYRKGEVRALAREAGLHVADKPDSVEICFVPDGDYGGLVRRRRPESATSGRIVDSSGRVLAEHPGIENFTVGQRKGLGFASGERRYVLRILPDANEVVVGGRQELFAPGLVASRVNWLMDAAPPEPLACEAKIRYRHEPAAATVTALPGATARVDFAEPQSAVTPGQAVAFYHGTRVLGGGWIAEAIGANGTRATATAYLPAEPGA
jgi:tRNA-specific 2-thiouridylase